MKNDISSEYLHIDSSCLRTDTKIGCDLYFLVETSGGRRFILYCRGDVVFENDKKDQLLEKNISKLFVKKKTNRNILITWNLIFKISYLIQEFPPKRR